MTDTAKTRQRISKLALDNLKVAERAELVELAGAFGLRVWRGEKSAFLDDGAEPLRYPTAAHARRNLRRIRPDLVEQLTSI